MKNVLFLLLAGLFTSCCHHTYHDEYVEEGVVGPYPAGVFEEKNVYEDKHYFNEHHSYHRH